MLIIALSKVSEGGCSCLCLEMGAPSCESKSLLKVLQFSDDLEWTSDSNSSDDEDELKVGLVLKWVGRWRTGVQIGARVSVWEQQEPPETPEPTPDQRPAAAPPRSILLSPPCDRTLLSQIL